jgi:hypothetical protein
MAWADFVGTLVGEIVSTTLKHLPASAGAAFAQKPRVGKLDPIGRPPVFTANGDRLDPGLLPNTLDVLARTKRD